MRRVYTPQHVARTNFSFLSPLPSASTATRSSITNTIPIHLHCASAPTASTLPRVSASNRLSKASIEDGKKSLRRTKHHGDHTGTAERRKKKGLSKATKSQQDGDSVSKDEPEPTIVIKAIEIDTQPKATNNNSEACDSSGRSEMSTRSESTKTDASERPAAAQTAPTTSDASTRQGDADKSRSSATAAQNGKPKPLIPFDANKEWEEIEKILESFGNDIGAESTFLDELERQFTAELNKVATSKSEAKPRSLEGKPEPPPKPRTPVPTGAKKKPYEQSVEDWLGKLALSEYAELLIENGFDDLLFMVSEPVKMIEYARYSISNRRTVRAENAAHTHSRAHCILLLSLYSTRAVFHPCCLARAGAKRNGSRRARRTGY